MNKVWVFYHALCIDGFAAAATVWRTLPQATSIAVQYNEPLPLAGVGKGDVLYFVDFAPEPAEIETLAALEPARVVILDHHKTMVEAYGKLADCPEFKAVCDRANLELTLDSTRSGAGLTWNHFFPDTPLPHVLACIQDRDLWQFKLRDSRTFYEYFILFLNKPFAEFNKLVDSIGVARPFGSDDRWGVHCDGLVFDGTLQAMAYQAVQESCETLARKRDLDIEFAMENCLTEWPLGEYSVAIINSHRSITSEMCDRIKDSYDVVATYFHKHRGSMVSLRSKSYDVATLAEKLGGGGHRNAAGVNLQFSITPEVLASMLHDAQTSLLVESEVKND